VFEAVIVVAVKKSPFFVNGILEKGSTILQNKPTVRDRPSVLSKYVIASDVY
jgi:hypothetical protein